MPTHVSMVLGHLRGRWRNRYRDDRWIFDRWRCSRHAIKEDCQRRWWRRGKRCDFQFPWPTFILILSEDSGEVGGAGGSVCLEADAGCPLSIVGRLRVAVEVDVKFWNGGWRWLLKQWKRKFDIWSGRYFKFWSEFGIGNRNSFRTFGTNIC